MNGSPSARPRESTFCCQITRAFRSRAAASAAEYASNGPSIHSSVITSTGSDQFCETLRRTTLSVLTFQSPDHVLEVTQRLGQMESDFRIVGCKPLEIGCPPLVQAFQLGDPLGEGIYSLH